MWVAKCVLAFDSLCGTQTGVTKRVLDFYRLCGARTGVTKACTSLQQSLRSSTGVREYLLAFNNLWTSVVTMVCAWLKNNRTKQSQQNIHNQTNLNGLKFLISQIEDFS